MRYSVTSRVVATGFFEQSLCVWQGKDLFGKGVKRGLAQILCLRCDALNRCATGDEPVRPLAPPPFFSGRSDLRYGLFRPCAQFLSGSENSYSGIGYLTSSTASSFVGKWFTGKTINDFVDQAKWENMINSGGGYYAYVWYRITPKNVTLTKNNTVEEFTVYPGCTRDITSHGASGGYCYYGWAERAANAPNVCSKYCPGLTGVYGIYE